jgi:hypothetical protein
MGGAKVGSLYAVPDSIIPELGQVPENAAELPARKQSSSDVFHDRDELRK